MAIGFVHDSECGRRSVTVAPINGSARSVYVKAEPVLSVRLVKLDIFGKDCPLFAGNT